MRLKKCILMKTAVFVIFFFMGISFNADVSEGFVDIDHGLVAYYPFSGNAIDESGIGNNGTVNGATLTNDMFGNFHSAYFFDGINDSISVSDHPSLHIVEQISLIAWIYPTQQKTQHIIRKGPEVNFSLAAPYGLALSGTGDIIFEARPDLQFTQVRKHGYALNEWTLVVGTYDGTEMRLYVNGKLENSATISGDLNQNNSSLLIGTRLSLPSDTFAGKIDEVRIFNRALSEDEIQEFYQTIQEATIDINPGNNSNIVNLGSAGIIPVAILTTEDFDATLVDPLSVAFGSDEAMEVHGKSHVEDVDEDDDLDLVLHFYNQATGISCGDVEVGLTGETFDGQAIEGFDSITTVGCE